MAKINMSPNGTQYQNIFCKVVERQGRGKHQGEIFTNFVGYMTVGNKVIKISLNPEPSTDNRGNQGYWVTAVATNLQPRGTMSNNLNRGAKF